MVSGGTSLRAARDRVARLAGDRAAGRVLAGLLGLAGALVPITPTAYVASDRVLGVGVVWLLGLAGTRAPRWTWLVLAGAAGALAGSPVAVSLALLAVLVGGTAAWFRRPLPALGAVACGVATLALLQARELGMPALAPAIGILATTPVLVGAYRHARPATRRRVLAGGGAAALLAFAATGAFAVAAMEAKASADSGAAAVSAARSALVAGDLRAARSHLRTAEHELTAASRQLGAPWARPAWLLPAVGPNARAATEVVRAARRTATQLESVLDGGIEDLRFTSGRIDVDVLRDLQRPVAELRTAAASAVTTAEQVDSPWLLPPVDRALDDAIDELRRTRDGTDLALEVLEATPGMLGHGGPRRYLVLFVTPAEARATGFPGNYAELVARDGRLSMTRFGRTSAELTLDRPADLRLPAAFLERYRAFGIETTWSAVTASPDFPRVAEAAAQLYAQSSGGRPVDGVMTVDPAGIAALLDITGPVTVPGIEQPLSSENAERFLLHDQYLLDDGGRRRVDVLELLGARTFRQLTRGEFGARELLAPALLDAGRRGHLRLASFVPQDRHLLHRVGLDHPLPRPAGADALAVVTTNAISGKVDAFLQREIEYQVDWDPGSGSVEASLEITLRNGTPSEGLPLYVLANALPGPQGDRYELGTNRMILSVYTPWEAQSITLDGRPTRRDNEIEAGYQVYDTEVVVPPDGGSSVLRIELSGRMPPETAYSLRLWNQVLANPDRLQLRVESRADRVLEEQLVLDRPREFHLPESGR